jgi:hypothetical protein
MIRKCVFILSICLAILSSLFGAAIIVVYYKQQDITQKALAKINEEFAGMLAIEKSYISPFTNFPYISIDLKNIRFFASKEMDGKPIYAAQDFYLGFNIWDILQNNYAVKKITILEGHLDLVKDQNGDINLLFAKGMGKQSEEPSDFAFDLSGVKLASFVINFHDLSDGRELVFNIDKLNTDLTLQPDQILLNLSTDLLLDLKKDGAPTFFVDKRLELDLDLEYSKNSKTLKIEPSKAILEEAVLAVSGQVQVLEHGLDLDIKFSGEKPDFNIFAAFLPKEVGETVKRYKNEGEVFFTGSVKGYLGEGQNPAVSVEFGAYNAYFLNTGIQKKVDELRFSGFFTNGKERNLKTSEIQLQQFHARPEEGIFQGRLIIRNFEDPYIKINLNADLDLAFLGAFFELEGLRGIQGQVVLNMDFDELVDLNLPTASISRVESSLQSELFLKNLSFSIPDYHLPVTNAYAYAYMRSGLVVLDSLRFTLGSSDFAFSGELNNFSSLLHAKEEDIRVSLQAKSKKIKFGELMYADKKSGLAKEEVSDFEVKLALNSTGRQLRNFDYLPHGEFFIEDFYAQLKHYPHRFYDFHADILIGEDQLAVKNFKGKIDESDFLFTGKIENYQKWFEPVSVGKSTFHFNLKSQKLKLKDLLSYNGSTFLPEAYYKEVISDLKLDGKLDLNYKEKFKGADLHLSKLYGKFNVHPLKLEGFQGRMKFEDSYMTLEKFGGRMGYSDFMVDMRYYMGSYDSVPQANRRRNFFNLNAKNLDLDALLGFESLSKSKSHADSFNVFLLPFQEMDFSAQVSRMNYHSVWLENVTTKLRSTKDHFLYVDTLSLSAADGKFGLKGYFNGSNPKEIYFHSEIHADKMDLDKLLFKMENFGKDIMINENLKGLVSGKIRSKLLVYPDLTPIINKSEAYLDLDVYQGSLINFAPMEAMSGFFADRNLRMVRFDTLSNVFELKNGVLIIPKMTINSSLGFIELSGRQSLDLKMDYFVRVPLSMVTQVGFRTLFGGRNRNEIDPDQEDDIVFRDQNRRVRFVNINIKGNPDDYKVSLGRDRN